MKKALNANRKNKKGFTLIELVIVIAILAILSAIAIPVILTTINSSKLSAMENDATTMDLLIKSAVMEYETGTGQTIYNNAPICSATKVSDILKENHIDNMEYTRHIGGVTYYMVWKNKGVKVSTLSVNLLTDTTTVGTIRNM